MNEIAFIILFILVYFSPVFYHLYFAIKESKKGNRHYLLKIKKIFKWSFIVLIPVIGFVAVISHTNFLDYETPITYERVDEINFENFRGIELFKKSLYGNERFAYIETSINVDLQPESLIIEALFHPSRSFVYKKNINSPDLLEHEIYHFKITELFVRKAKKKISGMNKPTETEISNIIKEIETEEKIFQRTYDYETFHSYVYGEQMRYKKLIDSSLNSLTRYSNPKIYVHEIN